MIRFRTVALLLTVSIAGPVFGQIRANDPAKWVTSADAPFDGLTANRTVLRLALKISKEGQVNGCKAEFVQPAASVPEKVCSLIRSRARYAPSGDKTGKPQAATDMLTYTLNRDAIMVLNDFGGAKPISPEKWITNDDYPFEAQRSKLGGRAEFVFVITPEGRATACQITSGTGHAILDEQTCRLVQRNARFVAPINGEGQPVETRGRASFIWAVQ